MFKRLKRIVYYVDDVERAGKWYADLLSMAPVFDTPFAVIFQIGNCSLSLAKRSEQNLPNQEATDTYWEVDDIDAAYDRFIRAGAKPHTLVKAVLNIRIAKVIDPFGNVIGITGAALDAQKATVEKQSSETAMGVTFCRALAAKEDRDDIRGEDTLAEIFLADDGRKILKDAASRQWAVQRLVTSPLYGYILARTSFFDDIFQKNLAAGIPQIVILGAGYDSRSYRYHRLIKETRIFEVDISSTQKRKREILDLNHIEIPKSINFVSVNFKIDDLTSALENVGFDRSKKTLFVLEGVIYYLKKEVVDSMMEFIKACASSGSSLAFDYLVEKIDSSHPGEPFELWMSEDGMKAWTEGHGLRIDEHVNHDEMKKTISNFKRWNGRRKNSSSVSSCTSDHIVITDG